MNNKKKIAVFLLGIGVLAITGLMIFLFYLNSDTIKVNHQLELAQQYLLEKEYEQAIAAFNTVTEIDPKNVEAYIKLAQAYTDNGDLENAIKTLEKGYEETKAKELQELKVIHTEELAQIKASKQEETVLMTDIKSQLEGSEIATTDITLSESTLQSEEITPIQTGFVTQDRELYYYEQGNIVTGWFEVNSKCYCAKPDGRLYRDGKYEVDDIQYLFGKDGSCLGKMPEMESEREEQNGCLVIVQEYQLDEYSDYEVYGYDGQGRLREAYYYPSKRETYSYDEQNRLSEIEYGGGGMSSYEVCSYDKQGKLNQLEYYYSSTGEWNRYDGHDVYSYDEQGRLSKRERHDSNRNLEFYEVYSYDKQNRLQKIENYNSNRELESYQVYSYDGQSRPSKYEDYNSDGRLDIYRIYSYDGQGRLSKSEWYDSNGSLYYYKVYSYDGQGQLTTSELAYLECFGISITYILTR